MINNEANKDLEQFNTPGFRLNPETGQTEFDTKFVINLLKIVPKGDTLDHLISSLEFASGCFDRDGNDDMTEDLDSVLMFFYEVKNMTNNEASKDLEEMSERIGEAVKNSGANLDQIRNIEFKAGDNMSISPNELTGKQLYNYTEIRYEFPSIDGGRLRPEHVQTGQRIQMLIRAVMEDFDFEERRSLIFELVQHLVESQKEKRAKAEKSVKSTEDEYYKLMSTISTIGDLDTRPKHAPK